ncbi:MAG: biopolymer transporter ExbD [Gemmatimonadetes bacterium]|jgi:biopolymer transport protein ExbD|nr:biopolymer transporter ExbD [Gemmatimonadota bacterium]
MARGSLADTEGVDLNLTPLIDCVFLLLIFFMVTTVFTSSAGLKIELPEAENWQKIRETKLFLSVDEDGKMELNSRVVTKTSLASALMREKKRTQTVTLIIKADRESQHVYTLDIMEIAKNLGIETISLAVDATKSEASE